MTQNLTRAAVLGAALAALAATTAAAKGEGGLGARLIGGAERPGPGDPTAAGAIQVLPDLAKSQLCYTLQVSKLSEATMAHIHKGPADASGPVVVQLITPTVQGSKGCVAADPALVKDIADHPAAYYVNVHTLKFPAGAIRGQLK